METFTQSFYTPLFKKDLMADQDQGWEIFCLYFLTLLSFVICAKCCKPFVHKPCNFFFLKISLSVFSCCTACSIIFSNPKQQSGAQMRKERRELSEYLSSLVNDFAEQKT